MSHYEHKNSKGITYYLNTKNVKLRGDREHTIYFFSKDYRANTGCELPTNKEVNENTRNGFLTVRNKV